MSIEKTINAQPLPKDWVSFHDEPSGAHILPNRFYGFGDSGFIAGSFHGYLTREEAMAAIRTEYDYDSESTDNLGSTPQELGTVAICVLSGAEYVEHIHTLEPDGCMAYGVLYTKFPFHLFKDWEKS